MMNVAGQATCNNLQFDINFIISEVIVGELLYKHWSNKFTEWSNTIITY